MEVSPVRSGGKELYRVRAGPVATREAATSLQARLGTSGHKATLVAP
jgi:cell division protein FtsN